MNWSCDDVKPCPAPANILLESPVLMLVAVSLTQCTDGSEQFSRHRNRFEVFWSVSHVIRIVFNKVNDACLLYASRYKNTCVFRYSVCDRLKCQREYGRCHLLLAINECVVLWCRLYEKQTRFLERVRQFSSLLSWLLFRASVVILVSRHRNLGLTDKPSNWEIFIF